MEKEFIKGFLKVAVGTGLMDENGNPFTWEGFARLQRRPRNSWLRASKSRFRSGKNGVNPPTLKRSK